MKNNQNDPINDPMKLTGSFTKKIRLSHIKKYHFTFFLVYERLIIISISFLSDFPSIWQ